MRGWIHDSTQVHDGTDPEAVIMAMLADPDVVQIHSRNVAWGCYMFTVTRGGSQDAVPAEVSVGLTSAAARRQCRRASSPATITSISVSNDSSMSRVSPKPPLASRDRKPCSALRYRPDERDSVASRVRPSPLQHRGEVGDQGSERGSQLLRPRSAPGVVCRVE